jgi:hypothetical protein
LEEEGYKFILSIIIYIFFQISYKINQTLAIIKRKDVCTGQQHPISRLGSIVLTRVLKMGPDGVFRVKSIQVMSECGIWTGRDEFERFKIKIFQLNPYCTRGYNSHNSERVGQREVRMSHVGHISFFYFAKKTLSKTKKIQKN